MTEGNSVAEGEHTSAAYRHHETPRVSHTIRYTPAEWAAIGEAARACGKTAPNFVRETSLGALPGGTSALGNAPLIRELGRCGTALAKLAANAQAAGALQEAASLATTLAGLLEAVRQLDRPERPAAAR